MAKIRTKHTSFNTCLFCIITHFVIKCTTDIYETRAENFLDYKTTKYSCMALGYFLYLSDLLLLYLILYFFFATSASVVGVCKRKIFTSIHINFPMNKSNKQ